MPKRITMADIAREAGVSTQTVSRAINDKGEISEETRDRICNIAKQLGFRPNYFARSLVKQQTTTIGIIIPDITNPFFSEIVRGVEDIARKHSYNVFLCNTDEEPKREVDALDLLLDKQVEGVILCSSRLPDEELVSFLSELDYAVLVNREPSEPVPGIGAILIDDRNGAYQAMEYLASKNHKRIAFLTGPERSQSGRNRLKGYQDAVAHFHLDGDPRLIIPCEPVVAGGLVGCEEIIHENLNATAVICYNDLVAIGAVQAALRSGLRIPEDISIVGFDDIPVSSLITPPLTTMQIPTREIGAAAMQLLMDIMNGEKDAPSSLTFQPSLIERCSTRPCDFLTSQ